MIAKTHLNPYQILDMDYYMFLSLRKEFILKDLKSTEDGRKALHKALRLNQKDVNERLNQKDADMEGLQKLIEKLNGK